MNNYLKILLYLKQHEGDGQLHELEGLLPDLPLRQQTSIFKELENEGFIILTGREPRYDSFVLEINQLTGQRSITESPLNELNNAPPEPYKARLTFKGSKYLKEELEMQSSGKYHINIGNSATANLILESDNAVIHNTTQVQEQIRGIIDTIKQDTALTETQKLNALAVFQKAESELTVTKRISKLTIREMLATTGDITTIGTAVATLLQAVLV